MPAHRLADTHLWDAQNIVVREGCVQPRPGMTPFGTFSVNDFGARPMGALQLVRVDQLAIPVVATTTSVWKLVGGVWVNITGPGLTGSPDRPVRMTLLEFGTPGVVYLVLVNGQAVQSWDGTALTTSAIAGSPPAFTDVATAYDRIIGLIPPYEVAWGDALSLSTWSQLNRRLLAETPDEKVAISAFGTYTIAVYGRNSIFIGTAQAGPPSQAFRFDLVKVVDGPAGPAARIQVDGVDYYMTSQGRLAAFDGANHRWIADGFWPYVQPTETPVSPQIDAQYARRVVATYDRHFGELRFYYPRVGDGGEPKGLVVCYLPQPEAGLPGYFALPGASTQAVTAAAPIRLDDGLDRLLLASPTTLKSYTPTGPTDDGTTFDCALQTGLKPSGLKRVAHAEPFVERGEGFGTLDVAAVSSFILDTPGGTVHPHPRTVDLTFGGGTETRVPFDAQGRFYGLRVSFRSTAHVRYHGAVLHGTAAL
jgi:hypothetical protein